MICITQKQFSVCRSL